MRLKHSLEGSSVKRKPLVLGALGVPHDLLRTLFKSSTVGVAICDRQFRYRAVNDALASMNGVPASAHLGKTLRAVLGGAAAKVQPAFEHVFDTGRPLSNFELTAELPGREGIGHWNESYFPINDDSGQVQQVGVIVLELTKQRKIEAALLHLRENLTRLSASLHQDSSGLEPLGIGTARAGAGEAVGRFLAQVESCISEAGVISQQLNAAPQLMTIQAAPFSGARALEPGRGQDAVTIRSMESEPQRSPLSMREREVVALLAKGKTNKEIATLLSISSRTVESHRARIMLKLDLESLSDLVRYAVRTEIIRL